MSQVLLVLGNVICDIEPLLSVFVEDDDFQHL